MNCMAFVKAANEDSFKPVTWGGLNYIAPRVQLEQMVPRMKAYFPTNEYKIEELPNE